MAAHEVRKTESRRVLAETGQTLVIMAVWLTVLMGMTALAIDVASWYRTQRHEQAVVDAAALAGAQELPADPTAAVNVAVSYATKNGVTINASEVTLSSSTAGGPSDTIKVAVTRPATAFFAKVFGINSANVHARAVARASLAGSARYVAPIVVPTTNPMLDPIACAPPPCTGPLNPTQIHLENLHGSGSGDAAGSFALLNLDRTGTGTADAGQLAEWMMHGDPDELPSDVIYFGAPSTNFNSSAFQDALDFRVGDEVLFPVYDPPILNGGSNGRFHVVGWVGFHIESQGTGGSSGTLYGYFTEYLAQGLPASPGSGTQNYGVRVVWLAE